MDTGVTYRTQGCTRVQVILMDSRHVCMRDFVAQMYQSGMYERFIDAHGHH